MINRKSFFNRHKISIIVVSIILIIFLSIFLYWQYENFQEDKFEDQLAHIVYVKLQSKRNIKKYSANKQTYNKLIKNKVTKVRMASDNQGLHDVVYYVAKINHTSHGVNFLLKSNDKAEFQWVKLW